MTTEDIIDIDPVSDAPEIDYDLVFTYKGGRIDRTFVNEQSTDSGYPDEYATLFQEFEHVDTAKKSVIAAMKNVNTEAMSWYNTLSSYKLVLNQTLKPDTFPLYARCTNILEDDINFLDGKPEVPSTEEPGGPTGTMTGDDPYPDKKPSVTEASTTEEPVTEESTTAEQSTEESTTEESSVEESSEEESSGEQQSSEETKTSETKPATTYKPGTTSQYTGDPADNK